MSGDTTNKTSGVKKKRGPAPRGLSNSKNVGVRLHQSDVARIDAWIKAQPFWMSRPEAIRTLVKKALAKFKP